ncbi:hypothetical protein [Vreelandella sulfidaeris]|tara:strand:- start:444 stop:944 length:501 start_codon:yes stop_codon:yes gene_type:complete
MVTSKEYNFLPQEQLNLACLQEAKELNRYRGLSLSFLPFDSSISRLMNAIGMECDHRLHSLQAVASQMRLDVFANVSQLKETPFFNKNSQHFFVVDENMGRQLLVNAEEAAEATYIFFSWLLETNATPELHQLLTTFVTQKNSEYRVLQECREQWKVGFSELSFAS